MNSTENQAAKYRQYKHDIKRVLAMDGGGIYGLFTVLMLKYLCRRDPNFLKGDDVSLFAGTSAGALIALVLANAENPRDIVMSGLLERFFADGRLYGQSSTPFGMMRGLFGLGTWTDGKVAEAFFKDYFGNLKMGQLKHKVLISTFDLYGNPDLGAGQKWKQRMYFNFPQTEENRELAVWRVAYGAAAPVMWRPIINGASDGGIFADSPTIHTIAKIIELSKTWDDEKGRRRPEAEIKEISQHFDLDEALGGVRLLSLGVGNKVPYYARPNFNLGYLSFNLLPTNLRTKNFWPPMVHLALEPQVEASNFQARQLLGDRFHRLDPEVLEFPIPPILASMYLSKFDTVRQFILKHIYKGIHNQVAMNDLHKAMLWIKKLWKSDMVPNFPPEVKYEDGAAQDEAPDIFSDPVFAETYFNGLKYQAIADTLGAEKTNAVADAVLRAADEAWGKAMENMGNNMGEAEAEFEKEKFRKAREEILRILGNGGSEGNNGKDPA